MSDFDRKVLSWLLFGAAGISGLIAATHGKGLIDNHWYIPRTVTSIDTERGRITATYYWFPYGTATYDKQIDKITSVTAMQESIDRVFGTGKVVIHGVVYTSAGSKDVNDIIPFIKNPHEAKNEILERLPERVGLELRVRDGDRMSSAQKVESS